MALLELARARARFARRGLRASAERACARPASPPSLGGAGARLLRRGIRLGVICAAPSTPRSRPLRRRPFTMPGKRRARVREVFKIARVNEADNLIGRVLVVEDDEDIADVLRRSLRQEGHEVRTAGDGEEALQHGGRVRPRPGRARPRPAALDGVEVCRTPAGRRRRADPDPDRPHRHRRPRRGPRRRRRRLPRQAVRARRAAGADARAAAAPPAAGHRLAEGRRSRPQPGHAGGDAAGSASST